MSMNEYLRSVLYLIPMLLLAGFRAPTLAQEVPVPDPSLNAAIREALQKPAGPLTEQDLLSLTNLDRRVTWSRSTFSTTISPTLPFRADLRI